jgi:microcystin-dependent protein
MPNSYTSSNITATIPSPTDVANVTVGFEQYHASIADDINSKQATITGAATTVVTANLGANTVVVTNSTGKIVASSNITTTELGVLDNLSSQSQILNPAGMITPYAGFTAPDGWLFCNGATITKSSYPNLSNVLISTSAVESIQYDNYSEGEYDVQGLSFNVSAASGLPLGGSISYPFFGYIVANAAAMSGSGLGAYYSANVMYGFDIYTNAGDTRIRIIYEGSAAVPSNFSFNNVSGEGYVYDIAIVLNNYRKTTASPTAPTIAQTTLPNLSSRVVYGPATMGANVGYFGGSESHTHSTSSLYAQIEREGSAIVLKETGTISSWTPTDRVVGSSGAANSTPTRTIGTTLGGTLGTTNHLPPYFMLNYIIKT